ncbi:AAA family ATPase, partial [Burkholderia cenocepacia]
MDKRIIDQAEGLRRLLAGRASRIVAVTGGPAGVGCTSTVVNLAAALASLGKDVLVVDERADVHSASATLAGAWLRDGERTRVAAGFGLCGAARLARAGYSDAQLSDFIDGPADIVLVDAQLG